MASRLGAGSAGSKRPHVGVSGRENGRGYSLECGCRRYIQNFSPNPTSFFQNQTSRYSVMTMFRQDYYFGAAAEIYRGPLDVADDARSLGARGHKGVREVEEKRRHRAGPWAFRTFRYAGSHICLRKPPVLPRFGRLRVLSGPACDFRKNKKRPAKGIKHFRGVVGLPGVRRAGRIPILCPRFRRFQTADIPTAYRPPGSPAARAGKIRRVLTACRFSTRPQ